MMNANFIKGLFEPMEAFGSELSLPSLVEKFPIIKRFLDAAGKIHLFMLFRLFSLLCFSLRVLQRVVGYSHIVADRAEFEIILFDGVSELFLTFSRFSEEQFVGSLVH